jgi:hypothetical protein
VSGEFLNIGDYLCGGFSPCGATDTTPFTDAIAGDVTLEGTEDKLLFPNKIKTYPEPTKGLAQSGCGIGQYADLFVLPSNIGQKVAYKLLVASDLV